ncbi:hypothetical protein BVZ63_1183 [Haemophilus influenzae]|nr:hypothetical protein HifGL_000767 [Haemophilus influenzae KR494]AIB46166.1 hypothetical protein H733_1349 [Haemophilus influenzae CGSHiCZ412602]AVI99821.1 hypothetical protein BV121_1227 [Haemophilus influenzae]CBW29449.1 unnamed protein product [Haemophilus influenzae 10810]AVJ01673.1 hypothetical protein BV122_1233 [Haemophilus influenzae]
MSFRLNYSSLNKSAVKIHRTLFFFVYPSIPSNSAVLK